MKMNSEVDNYRIKTGFLASPDGYPCGAFSIPFRNNVLTVIAFDGRGDNWEHVSVSLKNRCPNWEEMSLIKSLFWDEEESVFQMHPKKSDYINNHPYCLHLWRHTINELELPPYYLVGLKELEEFRKFVLEK